jgi:hypothetical protein
MSGAFATQQGNCSSFKTLAHCCNKDPVILDLMPEALPANRSEDCCRGGLLSAWAINPSKSFSSFEITVGNLGENSTWFPPQNLTLMAPGPGYTCGQVLDTDPTVSSDLGVEDKFRFTVSTLCQMQHYSTLNNNMNTIITLLSFAGTWKSTCTYSIFLANKTPMCCASLSTFYSPTITSCPKCSCGCREAADKRTGLCIRCVLIVEC